MANKYITLVTSSLISLTGKNALGKIGWEAMGTSTQTINVSSIKYSGTTDDGILYVLPINDVEQAEKFINRINTDYGITAGIIEEEEAQLLVQTELDNQPTE